MNVFLVDDHPLYRAGVKALLQSECECDVTEFSNVKEAVAAQRQIAPEMMFLDISLPDMSGLQALKLFSQADPRCRIFMLSTHKQSIYVENAETAGAAGYILKDDDPHVILDCFKNHTFDEFYLSPNCKRRAKPAAKTQDQFLENLSPRELEILHHLAKDLTSKEIGSVLDLSYRTVQNHRANIKAKLNLTRNSELVKLAETNKRLLDNMFGF